MTSGEDELPTLGARARVFGDGVPAEGYDRLRPGYPADAAHWLLGSPDRPLRVLDLGAGTGKLTAELHEQGHDVVAVDPSAEMLGVLGRRLPDVEQHIGRGEAIPLEPQSVDVVVVAQAWHWMDSAQTVAEVARVLRPSGALGLAWNVPDASVPWVDELEHLTSDRTRGAAETDRFEPPPPFRLSGDRAFPWVHRLDSPTALAQLAATWSWVALHPQREQILARVRRLGEQAQDETGRVGVPHQCYCLRYTM